MAIRIDQTLTQDATGTMAYLQFEAMGLQRVQHELAVSYVDHNTIQVGFENADDHRYLQSVAARYGIVFSRPGNGICHQVHLERFGVPGKTLLGSDSHTPTGGGLGMIAIGAGGLDIAVAMGGGAFHLVAPKVIEIRLSGSLRSWVSAKDVILTVLERFGVKGNVNCVFEYGSGGFDTLHPRTGHDLQHGCRVRGDHLRLSLRRSHPPLPWRAWTRKVVPSDDCRCRCGV
jgi:aconitate hydratase